MLVKDVMIKKVATAEPEMSVREAAQTMIDNRIGSLVILKNGKIVGMLTERDILKAVANSADFEALLVEQIMTRYIISVKPDANIEKAINLMVDNDVKKLPVISGEKLVGIITTNDIAALWPKIVDNLGKLLSKRLK